jgi:probable HAF family extracellular repeat protein
MTGLGDLPDGSFGSAANGVSADGSVIVGGGSSSNGSEAFLWTQADGMVGLGDLAGGGFSSIAYGVSADGCVVAGTGNSTNGTEAFRWAQYAGMIGLGALPGPYFLGSEAWAISADGAVIAGATHLNGWTPIRWTEASGMVSLGVLFGGDADDIATSVSGDGSVIVGIAYDPATTYHAFIWDRTHGLRSLQDVLLGAGVTNMAGWVLHWAGGISAISTPNHWVIVGSGTNPSGAPEAWRAELTILAPQITAIRLEGNDVRLTWTTMGGRSNFVQMCSASSIGGSFTNWLDVSPAVLPTSSGETTTNFLDVGAVTNALIRFYRIRLVP